MDTSEWWALLPRDWIGASAKRLHIRTRVPYQELCTDIALETILQLRGYSRAYMGVKPMHWKGEAVRGMIERASSRVWNRIMRDRRGGLTGDDHVLRRLTRAPLPPTWTRPTESPRPRLSRSEWHDVNAWLARVLCHGKMPRQGKPPLTLAYKVLLGIFRGDSLEIVAKQCHISVAAARRARHNGLKQCRRILEEAA